MRSFYSVDLENWSRQNIFEQLGNVSSEVGRSIQSKRLGDNEKAEQAMIRALDLFDATVSGLIKKRSPQAKEVLRAREEYLRILYSADATAKALDDINKYFLQFAIAARINR